MCLGIPALVIGLEGEEALVDVAGARRKVSTALVEGIEEGDYVIVHAGFIIQKIDADRAAETIRMIRELGRRP